MKRARWASWGLLVVALGAQGAEPRVIRLKISPAPRPTPALRYKLFPNMRELKEGNAVPLYLRAQIVGVNRFNRMNEASEKLELSLDKFPRDEIRKVIKESADILHETSMGARRNRAEWSIPIQEDGVATLLPEIQGMRTLARLLALKAHLALADGDYAAASETLETMFAMAHHLEDAVTLISSLVGIAIGGIASGEIEQWIGAPGSPNLYWSLSALPSPLVDLRKGFESEQYWPGASIPYLDIIDTSILSADQGRKLAQSIEKIMTEMADQPKGATTLLSLSGYSTAKRELIAAGRPEADVEAMPVSQVMALRWVTVYRQLLDEAIVWVNRPYPEARPAINAFEERVAAAGASPSGMLAKALLPALNAAHGAGARQARQFAMLRVIESIRLHLAAHEGQLPKDLSEITAVPIPIDPVTNEPFRYQLKGGGAVLSPSRPGLLYLDQIYELEVRR